MNSNQKSYHPLRLEVNCAFIHGTYWMSYCTIGGFMAVYLAYKGLTDSHIGLTSSLVYLIGIILQLTIANFSDSHFSVPIKYIITGMYVAAMIFAAMVNYVPMPVALMMIAFSLAQAISHATDCFINAMIVQFNNLGVSVKYGWPRSIGSALYALMALVMGIAIEKHSPAIIMPVFVLIAIPGILAVLFLPKPAQYAKPEMLETYSQKSKGEKVSIPGMLTGNPTFVLLLVGLFVAAVGFQPCNIFMIRIFERVGGGADNLGINNFFSSAFQLPVLCLSAVILKKVKCRNLVFTTIVIHCIRLFLLIFCNSVVPIYIISALSGINEGLYVFSTLEFANSVVRENEKVRAQSLIAVARTLGNVVGNSIAGVLIEGNGVQSMLGFGTCMCIVAGVIMFFCLRKDKKRQLA